MAKMKTWLKTDLSKPLTVNSFIGESFTYDNNGNQIGVKVYDNGEPVTLVGDVYGYIIRADGVTVFVQGEKTNNEALITLPAGAYEIVGTITIIIRLINGEDQMVIGACTGHVTRSMTNEIIDSSEIINLADLPVTIKSTTAYYQNSSNGEEVPQGTWLTEIPTTPQGQFLWVKTVFLWSNDQETIMYSRARAGMDGLGSVSSVNNLSPDSNGNVDLVKVVNSMLVFG